MKLVQSLLHLEETLISLKLSALYLDMYGCFLFIFCTIYTIHYKIVSYGGLYLYTSFDNLVDEFYHLLYQLQCGRVNFDEDRLSTLIFNPLCSTFTTRSNQVNSCSIDPDLNFYHDTFPCDYYTRTNLMKRSCPKNVLSICHFSITTCVVCQGTLMLLLTI